MSEIFVEDEKKYWDDGYIMGYEDGKKETIKKFLEKCKEASVAGVFVPKVNGELNLVVLDANMKSVWMDEIEDIAEEMEDE